jgi:hypothetical protein
MEVVTLWLLSSDNLTNRPAERARAAAARSSSDAVESLAECRVAGGCTRWARSTCCPPRPPPGSRRPRRRRATSTGCWSTSRCGYGGRREIADAVRARCSLEHAEPGHVDGGARRPSIDVEHDRLEHLYTKRPARPRPGDPHLGASSGSVASCSGSRPTRSSTSARRCGPTSGGSTSCARSGPMPPASAASAASPGSRRGTTDVICSSPRVRACRPGSVDARA